MRGKTEQLDGRPSDGSSSSIVVYRAVFYYFST